MSGKGIQFSKRKITLIFLLTLVLVLAGFVTLIILAEKPPSSQIENCLAALNAAREKGANRYAPELFRAAENDWQAALTEWRRQNDKWFFKRDFKATEVLLEKSTRQAEEALQKTISAKDHLQRSLRFEIALMKEKIDSSQKELNRIPSSALLRNRFAKGELLILESEEAYLRQDYQLAVSKLRAGEQLLGEVGSKLKEKIDRYLQNLPMWQEWIKETIAWSKRNKATVIIVDKLAHICQVYNSGKLKTEYEVEFGPNWIGDKWQRGDKATPEGRYFIKKKKGAGQTKYYRALEIDYPNQADWEKFHAAKIRGDLPGDANIGGLIEIHGEGGKGINWTDGCIALTNEEMDDLFKRVQVGTPVTIVGSLNGSSGKL